MAKTFEKYKGTFYLDRVDVDSFRKTLVYKHSPCLAPRYCNAGGCPQFGADTFRRRIAVYIISATKKKGLATRSHQKV